MAVYVLFGSKRALLSFMTAFLNWGYAKKKKKMMMAEKIKFGVFEMVPSENRFFT